MQWNPGDGTGIVDEIDDLCDSDSVAYNIVKKTRRANTAMEDLAQLLIVNTGSWQWDDNNYTTKPIGYATLVEGIATLQFASEFLEIENMKMLDVNGQWYFLRPIDQMDRSTPLENLPTTGRPQWYDKSGPNITLYPAPSATYVTLIKGLKAQFKRTAFLFALTDTTIQPGFASPFHILIAKMASLPFCKTYKPDRVPQLNADIVQGKIDIVKFYSNRQRDVRKQITIKKRNPR